MRRVTGWWSRLRRPWRRALVALASLVLLWCLLCIATWDGSVNIAVDYRQRMQDLQPVGPENERSWPLIRNAQSKEGEERLSLFRQAAGRARIGFQFHPEMEEPDLTGWLVQSPLPMPLGMLEESVIGVLLPHLPVVGSACKELAADMTAAVAMGDGRRATADALAVIGLASHVASPGSTMVQQLMGWADINLATTGIARSVTAHPEAFSDDDLSQLAAALGAIDPAVFRLDLTVERFMMEDILQRMYTDDGNGDGMLTSESSSALRQGMFGAGGVGAQMPRWLAVVAAPFPVLVAAPRAAVADRWNRYMDGLQGEADKPPWLRDSCVVDSVDAEMNRASTLERLRYELYFLLTPALGSAMSVGTRAKAMADAARMVVAAEQYRRETGRRPQSQDELATQLQGALPLDPWTGNPLRFGVVDGAIRVWSVSMDRTDEGGRPALETWRGSPRVYAGGVFGWFFEKGAPETGPVLGAQLGGGWIGIPNPDPTSPMRGDWVIWPHDPPAISARSEGPP